MEKRDIKLKKCRFWKICENYKDCFVCNNDYEAIGYCSEYKQFQYEKEHKLEL